MANNHINLKFRDEKTDEKILKSGFEAGATMAYLSMGKFEKDEENDKLKQVIDKLFTEFKTIVKHRKGGTDDETKSEESV